MSDAEVIDRILHHIDHNSTDLGDEIWQEPTEHYLSQARFDAEMTLLRRLPVPFCPSASLPEKGSYLARTAAGTALVAVRGNDGVVRAFRNACRHRGMPVAEGTGCSRTLVCPYHAWTYGLDGKLLTAAGQEGFPDLERDEHNLIPVTVQERGGLVFVTQDTPLANGALDALPELLTPGHQVFATYRVSDQANWKLLSETSMEGYHVKPLHSRSFLTYGFDNLNVIETQGSNARVTFPFKQIEDQRSLPEKERSIVGKATYVYQLFPNSNLSTQTNITMLSILEPVSPKETDWVIYCLSGPDSKMSPAKIKRLADFTMKHGLKEDREAACAVQRGLSTRANSHFTFGRYEKALVHFHKELQRHLDM
ncbi:aromatic ring-hydroxylating oxygenase subunit alpha [Rhodovibrionaceae bacterium A322]